MAEHRWSGWPGAFCLDCGVEDQNEICIGEHSLGLICATCGEAACQRKRHRGLLPCPEHVNEPCRG